MFKTVRIVAFWLRMAGLKADAVAASKLVVVKKNFMFLESASEVNRNVRRQKAWQRVGKGDFALYFLYSTSY